jgi:type III restriction enzyme
MLENLNPRFILELTATPRESSNIISTVRPIELKNEEMVKLPVIVYNDQNATQVLHNAISLRSHLEAIAEHERKSGGRYIRPIVLIQAEPKNNRDSVTFEKLKEPISK